MMSGARTMKLQWDFQPFQLPQSSTATKYHRREHTDSNIIYRGKILVKLHSRQLIANSLQFHFTLSTQQVTKFPTGLTQVKAILHASIGPSFYGSLCVIQELNLLQ